VSQDVLTREVLQKYRDEESELVQRIHQLEGELGGLHTRLQEVRLIRRALESTPANVVEQNAEPVSRLLASADATVSNISDGRLLSDRPVTSTSERRKGRRAVSEADRINDLGIVDAAIELARQRNVREADAGQILDWFKAAGYKGRHGLPTRNSIYVSLNREFQESPPDRCRVSRPSRGRFVFHF
jgi:hypothetical protein